MISPATGCRLSATGQGRSLPGGCGRPTQDVPGGRKPVAESRRIAARRAAVTLVALLTLTGLGLAGLLGNRGLPEIREAARVQDAEETAPSVAERAAEAILAYDHRSLDADRDAAERFMTSGFAEKYSDSFTKVVAPAAAGPPTRTPFAPPPACSTTGAWTSPPDRRWVTSPARTPRPPAANRPSPRPEESPATRTRRSPSTARATRPRRRWTSPARPRSRSSSG